VEFASREKLYELTTEIEQEIQNLADSFRLGNAIKSGIPVAIIGRDQCRKIHVAESAAQRRKSHRE